MIERCAKCRANLCAECRSKSTYADDAAAGEALLTAIDRQIDAILETIRTLPTPKEREARGVSYLSSAIAWWLRDSHTTEDQDKVIDPLHRAAESGAYWARRAIVATSIELTRIGETDKAKRLLKVSLSTGDLLKPRKQGEKNDPEKDYLIFVASAYCSYPIIAKALKGHKGYDNPGSLGGVVARFRKTFNIPAPKQRASSAAMPVQTATWPLPPH